MRAARAAAAVLLAMALTACSGEPVDDPTVQRPAGPPVVLFAGVEGQELGLQPGDEIIGPTFRLTDAVTDTVTGVVGGRERGDS